METTVVNVKLAYIRPKYQNLQEWMNDPNNVYIGRQGIVFIKNQRYPPVSSMWHNPFKIDKDHDRNDVLEKYTEYIINKIEKENLQGELLRLKNKTLGCWCKPEPCHGDILIELIKHYDS